MTKRWIDALEFENHGGWSPETQFAHEMGQGYLMAIGLPGEPVADASTVINVPATGRYRLWVRTKNWLTEAAPGRFRLSVDGERLPHELGALPCHGWYWDIAGDIELTAGKHEVCVQDTTGWFGRFAALIVTDDFDFTPSPEKERIWRERANMRGESDKPVDMGHFDVIVAGAGPAGIPAALAAARKGLSVALINSRPHVGGNSSEEAGVGFDGAGARHSNMRETGIADEIRRTMDFNRITWQRAEEMLLAAEKTLAQFPNQFVIDADVPNGKITSLTTLDCIDCTRRIYRAEYFIDCTGDGWLGYYSGACYRLGREPKWMYGEEFAPETADNETMSGCLMSMKGERHFVSYLAEDAGHFVPFTAPDWALKLPAGDSLHRFPGNLTSGEWWIENPTDLDDLWEQEEIRDELIRLSLGYFHWLKNSYARRDLAANLRLVSFPRYNAKRETRRLIGDYVLTQNDVTKVTVFDDAISYCGWTLDVHHPRGLFSGKEGPYFSDSYVPITSIPYRCIYSKNVSNLFMAGRCASVSHLALGTVRVESTLATLGQAAGTAAALCLEKGVMPRELGQEYIDLLQQTLLRDDQSIPWLRNHDSADLARSAHISADSFSRVEPFNTEIGVETGWDELDTPRATTVLRFGKELGTDENPDFFSVQLKNETDHPIDVPCQYIARSIVHPDVLESASITVPARFSGWIELPFTPQRDIFPWGVYLGAAPGVFWRQFDYTTLSRNRAFLQDRYTWKTNGNNAYCLKYSKRPLPLANCAPDNVINGLNRALSAQDYAWVSDPEMPLPQSITLSWNRPVRISELDVTTDTDSKHPSFSYQSLPVVKQTLKDFDVAVLRDGGWHTVCRIRGNYLRHICCKFDVCTADAVRVTALATYGDPSARIFEIRAYE